MGHAEQIFEIDGNCDLVFELGNKKMKVIKDGTKKCTKCGGVKPLVEFYVNRSSKDGKNSRCKACLKAYQKKRNQRPEVKNKIKEYRQRPESKEKERERSRRPEVKNKRREYLKEYTQRPEVKKRRREYQKEYRQRKH